MSNAALARKILRKQMQELQDEESSLFSVGLDNEDLLRWRIGFPGPQGTLYEAGYFTATLLFPEDFPNQPPTMKFEQDMWHPNIYPDGRVCISILHPPGEDVFNQQESAMERWRPIHGVESILLSVLSILSDPNLDSPANVDAAKQMKECPEEYKKAVRRLARRTLEG